MNRKIEISQSISKPKKDSSEELDYSLDELYGNPEIDLDKDTALYLDYEDSIEFKNDSDSDLEVTPYCPPERSLTELFALEKIKGIRHIQVEKDQMAIIKAFENSSPEEAKIMTAQLNKYLVRKAD